MTSILCLAHYCDLHGPTPLMVTEGLPIPCTTCCDHEPYMCPDDRPRTAAVSPAVYPSAAINDALRKLNLNSPRSSSVPASEYEAQNHRTTFLRTSALSVTSSPGSAIETPPESPRRITEPQQLQISQSRRDSSFRKTYDENVTKRANPCDNCALTVPRKQDSASNDPRDVRGPTLRTRAPFAKVYGPGGRISPPASRASSASDTDGDGHMDRQRATRRSATSTTSRSSTSSNGRPESHTHWVEYISTKEPLRSASFSIVRNSCLRTLSFETLPRAPATSSATPNTSPQSPFLPAFVTTQSAGSAASGGPIFFGDPLAGYTTAYIFRIPDVHARGHKRVYAFLALSTHRERLAMKTFNFIAAAFRDLAVWIQQLAEAEAERAQESMSPVLAGTQYSSAFPPPSQESSAPDRGGSSFLTGGSGFSRRMGGGGGAVALKARGLAELVGLPDFFIQLHSRFVRLLLEVGVKINA